MNSRIRRLIYKPEVLGRTGLSYPTVWAWMRDGKFPRSLVVGGKVAWFEHEIEAWLDQLPRRRLKGDPEPEGRKVTKRNRAVDRD